MEVFDQLNIHISQIQRKLYRLELTRDAHIAEDRTASHHLPRHHSPKPTSAKRLPANQPGHHANSDLQSQKIKSIKCWDVDMAIISVTALQPATMNDNVCGRSIAQSRPTTNPHTADTHPKPTRAVLIPLLQPAPSPPAPPHPPNTPPMSQQRANHQPLQPRQRSTI
jgi:hypothetical protein